MQELKHFVILLSSLIFFLNISSSFGLFDATITSVEMIYKDDTSLMDASKLRIRKVNRTQNLMSGIVDVYADVGDEYIFLSNTFKKSGHGYTKLPYKLGPLPFCQYVDEEKYFFETLRNSSNFPPVGTCPWPKKKYIIDGFYLNLEYVPPLFSSGEYKFELKLMLNEKVLNGLNLYFNLESVM